MSESIRITVLVENTVRRRGLKAEHGLALHVRFGRRQVLFDTGPGDLLEHNARLLDLDLRQLDAMVLSHGHYDHSGGLTTARLLSPACPLHLHPAAVAAKYSANAGGAARSIGMPDDAQEAVRAGGGTVWTRALTEVAPGLFATGEIPRLTDFEDVGGRFFLDEQCQRPDPLVDDQALFFETPRGLVVLLGCAHAGVVNTMNHVQQVAGGKPIRAVIGGLHLGSASEARIQQTIARLRASNLDGLAPLHCTGWPATARLCQEFQDIFRPASVGDVFEF